MDTNELISKRLSARVFPAVVAVLLALIVSACGSSTRETSNASATPLFDLQWPEGYSYDPATAMLTVPSTSRQAGLTGGVTITSITCTVTGTGMTPVTGSIDPVALTGTVYVPLGSARVFSVQINTNTSLVITGSSAPVDVTAGFTGPVTVTLAPNNPPVVTSVIADNMTPLMGAMVNITCAATDPDIISGDTLSYSWSDTVNTITTTLSYTTSAISYTMPDYNVHTITCEVSDLRGGVASGSVVIGTGVTPPAPPTGVVATPGDGQVTVTWSPVAGAISYNIYWSAAPGVSMASNLIPVAVSPYIHTGRVNGTPYYYAVTAVNGSGESALSSEVNATPMVAGIPLAGMFPDAILAACVTAAFPTAVYNTDVTGVLSCVETGITNLSGMENLTGLTSLNLWLNQIVDVTPLASLTGLTFLNLSFNQIVDVTPLSGLTGLTDLFLGVNSIVNVTPLSSLTGLTILDLMSNQIANVTPLSSLIGLTSLNLELNQIVDVTALGNLTGLTSLTLSDNQIVDVTPLAGLAGLTALYLNINQIVDVTPLASLTGLTMLGLSFNQIVDVTPLASLTALTYLDLAYNSVTAGVSALNALVSAQIYLSGNMGMSCADVNTLICGVGNTVVGGVCSPAATGLGVNVEISFNGIGTIDTPTSGTNCTTPVADCYCHTGPLNVTATAYCLAPSVPACGDWQSATEFIPPAIPGEGTWPGPWANGHQVHPWWEADPLCNYTITCP